jgi:hypothetical protein
MFFYRRYRNFEFYIEKEYAWNSKIKGLRSAENATDTASTEGVMFEFISLSTMILTFYVVARSYFTTHYYSINAVLDKIERK